MGATPARPDVQRARAVPRPGVRGSLIWIAIALIAGYVGLQVVLQIRGQSGAKPPGLLFVAAGLVLSVVGMSTVTIAAMRSGLTTRAAVALGGAFAAIAIAKFTLGPSAFASGLGTTVIQDPFELGKTGIVWLIAILVGLLYAGVILIIAGWLRPPNTSAPTVIGGVILLAAGITGGVTGAFLTDAPAAYLGFALTGAAATGIAVTLFLAATLVAVAFHDTARQAKALGTASVYLTTVWIAIAFLLVFQVLWIVFLLAVITIWPLRTVTPK